MAVQRQTKGTKVPAKRKPLSKPIVVTPLDVQVGGSHYKDLPIQPIEYCMMNKLDSCQSAVVKYITRFREKGGVEDLYKARHYIDLLIEFEERGNPTI